MEQGYALTSTAATMMGIDVPRHFENVSRETHERLDLFIGLLAKWNRTLNLVSRRDLQGQLRERHVAESLALVSHFEPGLDRLIDLGSGGGFPAIPVAILTGLHVDLIESDQRKAAFLETALATLELRGTVWPQRVEECNVSPAACVTSRALAALPVLLKHVHRLLLPGGNALFLKGDRAEAEVKAASTEWRMQADLFTLQPAGSRILKISRLEPTHDHFRSYAK